MELPPAPGPKLGPFQSPHGNTGPPRIEFLKELGQGEYSVVWKVTIDGALFALKLFKRGTWFQNLDPGERPLEEAIEKLKLDDEKLTYQCHAFFSECRAYGRLKETKSEHIAAKCYGYLILDRSYAKLIREAGIRKRHLIDDDFWMEWKGDHEEGLWDDEVENWPFPSPYPVKAIVKELMDPATTFLPKQIPRMLRDLQRLHRIGIVHGDIKEDAYVGGRLVDFSRAKTVPHFLLDKNTIFPGVEKVERYTIRDYKKFYAQLPEDYDQQYSRCLPVEEMHYGLRRKPDYAEMKRRSAKFFADRYKWKPSCEDALILPHDKEKSAEWARKLFEEGDWEDSTDESEDDTDWLSPQQERFRELIQLENLPSQFCTYFGPRR
ncbi:hypothetical protein G7054_g195 [Neopestalotiopsis clavispora]|nr:hypothetical protein G7054_g195 [Neopestalotiopsis clavispora]